MGMPAGGMDTSGMKGVYDAGTEIIDPLPGLIRQVICVYRS